MYIVISNYYSKISLIYYILGLKLKKGSLFSVFMYCHECQLPSSCHVIGELSREITCIATYKQPGIFFAILGRGPRAFQIGKINAVNHYFGKFSKQTRTAFLVSLKTKIANTHIIAIKLKENRMQF